MVDLEIDNYIYFCTECKESKIVYDWCGRDGRRCNKCGAGLLWYRVGIDLSNTYDMTVKNND